MVSFNGIQKGCALKLCRKMILSKQGNTAHALHQSAVFNQSVSVAHQLIESSEEPGFNFILGDVGRLAAVAGFVEPFILIITPPDLFAISFIALVAAPNLLAEMPSAIGANNL